MTGTQQRLLFLGDDAVAAAVAAVVDDASVATAERDAAPSATLDGDYDGVLVEDGSAEAIDAVRGITADEDAPDALLVTADCGGVDAAMDAGAVDYVANSTATGRSSRRSATPCTSSTRTAS
ncbi:hypothetical protein BRD03_00570 [Halobacteriales archaeon QS_9_68_17]|nr:MAG: hypothetical protein BRD03_00570 [Halobacteriales archaeon QS_9_68_17]